MPHSVPGGAGADKTAANVELFAGAFFEAAGPALTTALNRAISVRVVEVAQAAVQEVVAALSPPWVFAEISYQRGASGTHWLVLSREAALALAAEDTETVDLEPRHQEAIRDTVNQLLLAAGPPLLPLFARSVAFAATTVHVIPGDSLPGDLAPEQRVWVVRAEATGDDLRVEMALTIDEELAAEIAALGAAEPAAAAAEARAAAPASSDGPSKIDLILDVTLPVAVELGRARLQIQDILKLAPGSVIALDKSAGDPVELLINDRPIAKGEVVIIDENFGVRLTSIVTATERIRTLR
jgi:flagellar motor switch protein FliN/FliY